MEMIQIVLERELLEVADRAVRKFKTSRSALICDALRIHLRRLDRNEREKADREGFVRYPDSVDRPNEWDRLTDWPVG
jgi:metal-responsive CopG/Arc/MetJ family transcriptional regulator